MSMIYSNELQLPDIEILNKQSSESHVHYDVKNLAEMDCCPYCGSENFVKNGVVSRNLKDAIQWEKTVSLLVHVHRYQCRRCGQGFIDSLSFAGDRDKITYRLQEQIEKTCFQYSIKELAEKYDLSTATIHRITKNLIAQKEAMWKVHTPANLGLVDMKRGKPNIVLCIDMDNAGIVEVLDYKDSKNLTEKLLKTFDISAVEHVFIDFIPRHRDAINELAISGPMAVVERTFVIYRLNIALSKDLPDNISANLRHLALKNPFNLTQDEKDQLQKAGEKNPVIKGILEVKNLIYNMYELEDKEAADKVFRVARAKDASKNYEGLRKFFAQMQLYHDEIFAYFDVEVERSGTVRDALRYLQRQNPNLRSYNYKSLRARIMFGIKPRMVKRNVTTNKVNTNPNVQYFCFPDFSMPKNFQQIYVEYMVSFADAMANWDEEDFDLT